MEFNIEAILEQEDLLGLKKQILKQWLNEFSPLLFIYFFSSLPFFGLPGIPNCLSITK